MSTHTSNEHQPEAAHGTMKSYTVGFILSIALTLAAYFLVVEHVFSTYVMVAAIIVLAIVQLLVQLVFFLHLGSESKPRWNLTVFAFMAIVLAILVFGTLWIMHNLDYHMGSPQETDQQIIEDELVKVNQ